MAVTMLGTMTLTAMPVMIVVLCCMAIAYRYYSAFLAAKVAALDDSRVTPAIKYDDGQNYHPTSKWVLFGHHFAAISGAGPLIGPVLAAQFGYLPGLIWIVVGVCLGGAVQDFLVLSASLRRGGKSLAQIALSDIGRVAGTAATAAILFIIILALAGLGKVVVKALGGERVEYPPGSRLVLPNAATPQPTAAGVYEIPMGTRLVWGGGQSMVFTDNFDLQTKADKPIRWEQMELLPLPGGIPWHSEAPIPLGAVRVVRGSSWGTFTIACTIPIALFVGFYMYRLRKGKVVEASLIGGGLTLAATALGGFVANRAFGEYFNLTATQITIAMAIYGFVAAVLPVWVLLAPRDYLSSFLKIGTIGLLVIGVIIANPKLQAPAINHLFLHGGPVLGKTSTIFPFLFITIMCGAISGFHALVSSGTTPKMVMREGHARTIGYGAMLIEGLVGVVALVAAASLSPRDYYGMNTPLAAVPQWQDKILQVGGGGGIEHVPPTENLNRYEELTREPLRGRVGGAVTLAVGMASIFDSAAARISTGSEEMVRKLWAYWYHFAIMFEALFILTTIDAGTRIGRFLVQEVAGKIHPSLGRTNWWPGAIVSTLLVVCGWAFFMNSDSFDVIWKMFGIANQVLAVIALTVVSTWLCNEGRRRYLWVTAIPLLVVMTTTGTAAVEMLMIQYQGIQTQLGNPASPARSTALFNASLQASLIVMMLALTATVLVAAAMKIWKVTGGFQAQRGFEPSVVHTPT